MLKRGRARRAERTRKSTSVGGAREWERARERERGRRMRERARERERPPSKGAPFHCPLHRDTGKQSSSLSARCYPPPSLPASLPNSVFPLPSTRPPPLTCFTLGTDDVGIKAPGTLGNRTETSTAFRPSTRDIAKRSALSSRLSIRDAEGK